MQTVTDKWSAFQAELDRRATEIERLRAALVALHALAATMKFEPDAGEPHPLKDGVYDKIMSQAREALEQNGREEIVDCGGPGEPLPKMRVVDKIPDL